MSSAEAEYYSMVDGLTRAKGLQTVGLEIRIPGLGAASVLGTDSSAAKSFASRRGVGRIRRMEVRYLWLQGEVLRQKVRIFKVKGEDNPADLLTKHLAAEPARKLLRLLNLELTWAA